MKLLRILAIACIGVLTFLGHSFACTCGPTLPTPEEEFNASDAVFVGQVIQVFQSVTCETASSALVVNNGCWKGVTNPILTVYTPGTDACCGIRFQPSVQYLFYASGDVSLGGLWVGLCSRTGYLDLAAEDLAYLGEPGCTVPVHDSTWGAIKALYSIDNDGNSL